jgi:hypothetical protein
LADQAVRQPGEGRDAMGRPAKLAIVVKTKNVLLLLLGAAFLTGCMHSYDVTLVNNMKITRVSKPKLDQKTGLYSFTDVNGKKKFISAYRVVEIAPHTDVKLKTGP